jgi:hypothetical protein
MSRPAAPRESTHAALELGLATRAILHRRPSEDGRDDGRRRLASRERPANRTGGGLERACSDSGATRAFPMLRGRSGSVVELRRTVAGLRLGHARERDAAYAPPVAAPGAHECGQPPSPPKGLRQRPPAHPDGPRQVSDNSFRRAHAPASARGGSGSGNGNRASKAPCAPDVSNLLLRAHAPPSARSGSGGGTPEGSTAVLLSGARVGRRCHGLVEEEKALAIAESSQIPRHVYNKPPCGHTVSAGLRVTAACSLRGTRSIASTRPTRRARDPPPVTARTFAPGNVLAPLHHCAGRCHSRLVSWHDQQHRDELVSIYSVSISRSRTVVVLR